MNLLPPPLARAFGSSVRSPTQRRRIVGWGLLLAAFFAVCALVTAVLGRLGVIPGGIDNAIPFVVAAGAVIGVLGQVVSGFERQRTAVKIQAVEQRVRQHPEKPQLAWDLARIKLESYLDRNLSQVRSIYWLTLIVMIAGFSLIVYGLQQSFNAPDKIRVSIVASASGVLISFIGGSFLLIYRAILAQSKDYVSVLERINAVGMAVQVLSNISPENTAVRDKSTAELSKQLLSMYGTSPASTRARRRTAADTE